MKRLLLLTPFLAASPLTAQSQSQHEFTGVERFLTLRNLDGSGIHFKMNRVSNAGDVNNDGIDDYLVGIPGADMNAGAAYVYSGRLVTKGPPDPVELFYVAGGTNEALGAGVCTLGDVDGDGYADFAVAASRGQYVNIYSGQEGLLLATIQESPDTAGGDYGRSLAAVDLDGDGRVELAVADPNVTFDGNAHTGFVELFRLTDPGDGTLDVTSLAKMEGIGREWFGADLERLSTGSAADYLLVGSPRMDATDTEQSHGGTVHILRDDPFTPEYDLQTILVIEDTHVQNIPGQFGHSVAAVGDIRGDDGVEEFAVGAPQTETTAVSAGKVTVYDTTGAVVMSLDGTMADEGFGFDVAGLGDVDGDRIPDFLVAAPGLVAGPGAVHIHSGDDGSLIHTLTGEQSGTFFGVQVATASDIDGDGSRDIILTEFDPTWQQSLAFVFRPLHSLPYRISVDASPTGVDFAAVHGVNHGPLHKGTWSKRIEAGSDVFWFTNFDADFSNRYEDLKIPQARITGEGIGGMNYIWGHERTDLTDSFERDYTVPLSEMTDIENYNFIQMDDRMDSAQAISGMETIWRVGHDKGVHPLTDEWMAGFHEPPNDNLGFSEVVAGILRHYNEGWGRDVPAEKLKFVELWNEPSLESWTGTAQQFADLQVELRQTLDREFDQDGDGRADDLVMLTPVAPGYFGNFTVDFLDTMQLHYDPLDPGKTRFDAVVDHIYSANPRDFVQRLENFDYLYEDIEATKDIFRTGPNQETELPEVWITEWNRDLNDYARTAAAMPFIMNTFFYMNQVCAGEVTRTDGKPLRVRLGGAQFFGSNDMWIHGIDPDTGLEGNLNRPVGLAWEVYGKTLYQDANERLAVSGTFHEGRVHPSSTNPVKDFTVMAGRSETEEMVVLVVSSMRLEEPDSCPIEPDYGERLPYEVDVEDLGFTPLTVERLVQEDYAARKQSLDGANLVDVPAFGSTEVPYGAWTTSFEGDGLTLSVDDMVENTYEVIIIRGQQTSAPGPDGPNGPDGGSDDGADAPADGGPGVQQIPDAPIGRMDLDRSQVTIVSNGNGTQNAQAGGNTASAKKPKAKRGKAKAKHKAKRSGKTKAKTKSKFRNNKTKARKGAKAGAKKKAKGSGKSRTQAKKGKRNFQNKAKGGGKVKRGKVKAGKKLTKKKGKARRLRLG